MVVWLFCRLFCRRCRDCGEWVLRQLKGQCDSCYLAQAYRKPEPPAH